MASLLRNILRTPGYRIGGLVQALCFPTYTDTGQPALTVTRNSDGLITGLALAGGVVPAVLEFEENTGLFSDDVKIGDNRFPEPTVGYKFSGHDDARNSILEAFDLTKTTHLVKLSSGKIKLVGEKNGLQATQSKSGAGAKHEDFEGYDVVLVGAEVARCPDVPEGEFNDLLALAYD